MLEVAVVRFPLELDKISKRHDMKAAPKRGALLSTYTYCYTLAKQYPGLRPETILFALRYPQAILYHGVLSEFNDTFPQIQL